jgi:pilus assembly protein CpaE
MGYDPTRIALLLNRADTRVGITHEDVAAIIGRTPDVFVPSDRQIPISVNDGTPIVLAEERSEVARSFRKLANVYTENEDEHAPQMAQPEEPAPVAPAKRRFAWKG